MSVSLSPALLARVKSVQLFVTILMWPGGRRLALRPVAPIVVWDPVQVGGVTQAIVCLDAAGEEVQRWECAPLTVGPSDSITLRMS